MKYRVEQRGEQWVVVGDGFDRVASSAEIWMWREIESLRKALADVGSAVREMVADLDRAGV